MQQNPYIFGEVIKRNPNEKGGSFVIKGADKNEYSCNYSDLLTDGFKILSVGDKVRFIPKNVDGKLYATYIIKIAEEYDEGFFYE